MKKNHTLIICCGICLFCGCVSLRKTPDFVKENYTFFYDEKSMVLDKLLDIQGFYIMPTNVYTPYDDRVSHSILLFFSDGIVAEGTVNFRKAGDLYERKIIPRLYNGEIISDTNKDSLSFFYQLDVWGTYKIEDDTTIKAQFIKKAYSLNSGWNMYEKWYKILDNHTIQEFANFRFDENGMWVKMDYRTTEYIPSFSKGMADKSYIIERTPQPSIFLPLDSVPSSNSWIKSESWFWKHQSEWRKYMENSENK